MAVSSNEINDLLLLPRQPVPCVSAIKPEARHRARFQYLRAGFGNYEQDIMLRLTTRRKCQPRRRKRPPPTRGKRKKKTNSEHEQNSVARLSQWNAQAMPGSIGRFW